jgi:hypothetical protein
VGAARAWLGLVLVAALVAGLAFARAESPAEAAAGPILDPATVLVSGAEMCSGTFVARSTLLTAKHCVAPEIGSSVALSQPGSGWACTGRTSKLGAGDWATVDGCIGLASHPIWVPPAPSAGYPVRAIGYPYTLGARSQEQTDGQTLGGAQGELYLDLPLVAGYSGAGLIDKNDPHGPVIAVISWRSASSTSTIRSGAVMTSDDMARIAAEGQTRLGAHRLVLPSLRVGHS